MDIGLPQAGPSTQESVHGTCRAEREGILPTAQRPERNGTCRAEREGILPTAQRPERNLCLGRAAVAIVGRAPCAGRRRPRRQRQARQHPRPRESKVPIGMRICCASNESLGARMLTATWLLSRVSTVPGQCPVSARYSARSVPGSAIVEEFEDCDEY